MCFFVGSGGFFSVFVGLVCVVCKSRGGSLIFRLGGCFAEARGESQGWVLGVVFEVGWVFSLNRVVCGCWVGGFVWAGFGCGYGGGGCIR